MVRFTKVCVGARKYYELYLKDSTTWLAISLGMLYLLETTKTPFYLSRQICIIAYYHTRSKSEQRRQDNSISSKLIRETLLSIHVLMSHLHPSYLALKLISLHNSPVPTSYSMTNGAIAEDLIDSSTSFQFLSFNQSSYDLVSPFFFN